MEELSDKVNEINNKCKNKEYEEALTLLESISFHSSKIQNYEDNILQIIKQLFQKLMNEKEFDKAIEKIDYYKRKYSRFNND